MQPNEFVHLCDTRSLHHGQACIVCDLHSWMTTRDGSGIKAKSTFENKVFIFLVKLAEV